MTAKKLHIFGSERAQTMVEFALVFPIVLLITYGIIEFGRMVFIYAAVTGAAREGARYGAASGTISGTRFYKDCPGIRTATKRGAILIPINDADITIWYDNGPSPTSTWTGCPPVGSNSLDPILLGDRIVVQVDVDYQPIMGSFLGVNGFHITSQNARTILLNVEMSH
ncbi:MAG: hypothetical protein C3F13_12175 [Anaerolineales bacterium]|nr:pilus assembly protein [Anaerolineae bacterium]PWB52277.1 MAG: hypothetical protein C3F13_12175 [Anaerolineales bacterium]